MEQNENSEKFTDQLIKAVYSRPYYVQTFNGKTLPYFVKGFSLPFSDEETHQVFDTMVAYNMNLFKNSIGAFPVQTVLDMAVNGQFSGTANSHYTNNVNKYLALFILDFYQYAHDPSNWGRPLLFYPEAIENNLRIPDQLYYNVDWINALVLNQVTVGKGAFINSSLSYIELKKSTIESQAFQNCKRLKQVVLEDCHSVSPSAFSGTDENLTIVIPSFLNNDKMLFSTKGLPENYKVYINDKYEDMVTDESTSPIKLSTHEEEAKFWDNVHFYSG